MKLRTSYDGQNVEAAAIIAADPVKYPPHSLPAIWERLVQSQHEQAAKAKSGHQ